MADCVAKRFCASERARLIQDHAPICNVDSRFHSPRFDRCVFLFYSLSAVTFATQSAQIGSVKAHQRRPLMGVIRTEYARCEPFRFWTPFRTFNECGTGSVYDRVAS